MGAGRVVVVEIDIAAFGESMVGRLCRRVVEVIVDVREASTLQSEEKQSSSWLTLVVVVAVVVAAAAGPTNSYSQCRKKLISWSSGHSILDNATVLLPVMLLFYFVLLCSALLMYCSVCIHRRSSSLSP